MGVLLTVAAIAISGSAGVVAERRWPASAVGWARRLLVISLYTLSRSSSSSTWRGSTSTPTSAAGW